MYVRYLFRPSISTTSTWRFIAAGTAFALYPYPYLFSHPTSIPPYYNNSLVRAASASEYPTGYSYPFKNMASAPPPTTRAPQAPASQTPGYVRALSTDSSTTAGMVPITRAYLAEFYSRFPDPSFSDSALKAQMRAIEAGSKLPKLPVEKSEAPRRMDEGMFAARCACEEGVFALKNIGEMEHISVAMAATGNRFKKLQDTQRAHATRMINSFLPSDIRGRLFNQASARSEQRSAAALTALEEAGGTVREKYELLWKQQFERRENLSAIGNASGAFKLLVRYIGGVPEPLLDFARQINQPNGPTEEIRVKFGPTLVKLIEAAQCCAGLAEAIQQLVEERNNKKILEDKTVKKAVKALGELAMELLVETEKFCALLETVVEKSPFFLPAESCDKK